MTQPIIPGQPVNVPAPSPLPPGTDSSLQPGGNLERFVNDVVQRSALSKLVRQHRSKLVALLFGPANVQQQIFTVTFSAAPVGFNAFSFSLPEAFPSSFIGGHATPIGASVGGAVQTHFVIPASASAGTVYLTNPSVQTLVVLFTAYGT